MRGEAEREEEGAKLPGTSTAWAKGTVVYGAGSKGTCAYVVTRGAFILRSADNNAVIAKVTAGGLLGLDVCMRESDCRVTHCEVAESACAHSYYSISTGMQTAHPRLYHFLTPVSKSVLYTFCSVKKCLIHSI